VESGMAREVKGETAKMTEYRFQNSEDPSEF
jgi:hypothetical protein